MDTTGSAATIALAPGGDMRQILTSLVATAILAASASAQVAAIPRQAGYLGAERLPDSLSILPPPPGAGSLAEQEDKRVFADTRKLEGTDRWTLAARDAVNYLGAYDCALGVTLDLSKTPHLRNLLSRMGADASVETNKTKDYYKRPRPFVGGAEHICREDQRAGLTKSPAYPSGHSTFGWSVGLVLSELAPDKATALLMRARSFGESRVVCGVHYVSDIEEGRTNGAGLVAALHADPEFRADMDAARKELADLRKSGGAVPEAGECRIENDAAAHTPWKR